MAEAGRKKGRTRKAEGKKESGNKQAGANKQEIKTPRRSESRSEFRNRVSAPAAVSKKPENAAQGCPYGKKCGGCHYTPGGYEAQLKKKEQELQKRLGKYCRLDPMIGMDEPFHYRNKVHAVMARDRRGNIISGTYREGTHEVVAIDGCMIEDEKSARIVASVRELAKAFKIKIYDEDTQYGLLRHVLVRRGFASGQIMVVLVTASPVFPSKNNFVKALLERHPEITTIIQNINGRGTSMVLGSREHVFYGKGYIEDELSGMVFRISPKSFYQVNPVMTQKLYQTAIQYANLTGTETVIDAYCGIGTIGLLAARRARSVIGVELNRDAVRDAVYNAKRNEVQNARFYAADAGDFMVDMANQGEHAQVVFLDPPRSGSTEKFMDALAYMAPETVVYISCNPVTLERDLEYMGKNGYKAVKGVGVDMFGWTGHVETVTLLVRKP